MPNGDDHDLLIEIKTDLKWVRRQMEGNTQTIQDCQKHMNGRVRNLEVRVSNFQGRMSVISAVIGSICGAIVGWIFGGFT